MRFSSPMFLSQGWLLRGLSIAGAIALTLTGLLVSAPAQSQNAPGDAPDRRHSGGATYIKFKPPTLGNTLSNAPGGRQRGGGSRGDCPLITQPLTALAPETVAGAVGGLTTEDHPTFWFYVPYALTDEHPAEFVLLDEQNKYVYQTTLSDARSTATGVVGITLPDTITLEAEKSYQWVFMVNCEMDNPIFTRGNIQKVNLDTALTQQIARSEPLQQARLYAENGIWFDALTTLAVLRMDQPEDQTIAAAWRSLLRSVDLADIIGKPFMRP